MRERGRRGRARRFRVVVGLLGAFAVVSTTPPGVAAPSQDDVAAARAELQRLEREFEQAVERYNTARYELSQNQERLADAKASMEAASGRADRVLTQLADRAVEAYTGMGSQMGGLLDAGNFTEFNDRLEFMGAISDSDVSLANRAEIARQEAEWAAEAYAGAVDTSRAKLEVMEDNRAEIDRLLDRQAVLYEEVRADYASFVAAQRAAAERAAAAEPATATAPAPSTGGGGGEGNGGGSFVPPPDASKAQIAVQAALSVVGTRYVWGSSDPSVGLDCSGVTVYAWRQAGVALPHSSQAQYGSFPKIPLSAVQPGDLVYYGNYGPHIAIYVGGGRIVHASSPAPGGQTRIDSMYGYDRPWGAVRVT